MLIEGPMGFFTTRDKVRSSGGSRRHMLGSFAGISAVINNRHVAAHELCF
jgi:hypothetical protein